MEQINTMSQVKSTAFSSDVEKAQLTELAQEYLNSQEVNKKIRNLIGRGTRFNVNMDELR